MNKTQGNTTNSNIQQQTNDNDDNNVNDIIASIKKENEELLSQLNQQKALNEKLRKTQINNNENDYYKISDNKSSIKNNGVNGSSLSEIILNQNKVIQDFGKQIKQIQMNSHKKIKELQVILSLKMYNMYKITFKKHILLIRKRIKNYKMGILN